MFDPKPFPKPAAIGHIAARCRYPASRSAGLLASVVAITVLAAGCSSAGSAPTTTKAPSTGTGGSTRSVKLASATLPGVGSVVTGPTGRTLYYFTEDSSGFTRCTGQCAAVWPPLVVPSGTKPVLSSGLGGTVGTALRPDGSTQVTYDGHLMYYYQGDMTAGQDKGQGLEGTWFVVPTSATSAAAMPTTSTTGPGGGGGGVGF